MRSNITTQRTTSNNCETTPQRNVVILNFNAIFEKISPYCSVRCDIYVLPSHCVVFSQSVWFIFGTLVIF